MILLYRVLTNLLYPFLFIFIYLRKILKKEDPIRFKEKIFVSSFNIEEKIKSQLIWFHAASIGEFKSVIPLIYELNNNHQNLKFLITTTTLSSGNLAELELIKIKNAVHRYIPYDVAFLMDKFLKLWKPDKIFLVDSEIWPNLILKAKEHNIPIALLNARLTAKTFKKWSIFPNIAKKIFGVFDLFLCSNLETKIYLERLNLKNIYFVGNIKLIDLINDVEVKNINETILLNKRFWLAASTHSEEDIFCIKAHLKLKEKFNDIITIIAPRHIIRSDQIKSLSEKFKLKTQILNKNEKIKGSVDIVIVNYFGALKDFFKYAKSVFIGKSMIKKLKDDGGQNPIEAAKLECKIYHGPYVYNFEEIYKILAKNGVSKEIKNFNELCDNLFIDLKNNNKNNTQHKKFIYNLGQKTLSDTMRIVDSFLYDKIN